MSSSEKMVFCAVMCFEDYDDCDYSVEMTSFEEKKIQEYIANKNKILEVLKLKLIEVNKIVDTWILTNPMPATLNKPLVELKKFDPKLKVTQEMRDECSRVIILNNSIYKENTKSYNEWLTKQKNIKLSAMEELFTVEEKQFSEQYGNFRFNYMYWDVQTSPMV